MQVGWYSEDEGLNISPSKNPLQKPLPPTTERVTAPRYIVIFSTSSFFCLFSVLSNWMVVKTWHKLYSTALLKKSPKYLSPFSPR